MEVERSSTRHVSVYRSLSVSIWMRRKMNVHLEVEHEALGVLDNVLDALQEEDRLAPVDEAMVVGQSDVHHGADLYLRQGHKRCRSVRQ